MSNVHDMIKQMEQDAERADEQLQHLLRRERLQHTRDIEAMFDWVMVEGGENAEG